MSTKKLIKALGLIIVVALLAAVLPMQAKAQEEPPQTLNVAQWTGPTKTGITGRETVLKVDGTYHMWYSNATETELTHAFSVNPDFHDAKTEPCTFEDGAPIGVGSVSVIKDGGSFFMIAYGADEQEFAIYKSSDGNRWGYSNIVLDLFGTEITKIDGPYLFKDDATYRLFFQGKINGEIYAIFEAKSANIDGPYTFTPEPVLLSVDPNEWDGGFVMHPWVVKADKTYYLWYSAHNGTDPQRIGMAKSEDGINWVKSPGNPIFDPATGYAEPSVITDGETWQMWTMGTGGVINYLTATGPFEFQSIQAAIDAASDGDVIKVSPGTYAEDVVVTDKFFNLIGAVDTNGDPVSILEGSLSIDNPSYYDSGTPEFSTIKNIYFERSDSHLLILKNFNGGLIENCVFDGNDGFMEDQFNGVNLVSGGNGNSNITVKSSTFKDGLYVSINGYANGLTVIDSDFTNVKSGINLQGGGGNLDVQDSSFLTKPVSTGDSYGIRFASSIVTENMSITGSTFAIDDSLGFDPVEGDYHVALYVRVGAKGTLDIEDSKILGDVVNLSTVTLDATNNWWGSIAGPGASQIGGPVDFTPWCTDAACVNTAPDASGNVNLSGDISVPGGILINEPGITYHLAADTVIQNDSPCFVINASNTTISGYGAVCKPTGDSNGIDVAANLFGIVIEGLEIDGSEQTPTADVYPDGIHFAGPITNFQIVNNYIHNLGGNAIEFVGTPSGTTMDIQGNLFETSTLGTPVIVVPTGLSPALNAQYNNWDAMTSPTIANVDTSNNTYASLRLTSMNTPWPNQVAVDEIIKYNVVADLQNVTGAAFTLSYPTNLTLVATDPITLPGVFTNESVNISTTGKLVYIGYNQASEGNPVGVESGSGIVLFTASFTATSTGSGALTFSEDGFSMMPPSGPSNLVYTNAMTDGSVTVIDLPTLTWTDGSGPYSVGYPHDFTLTVNNPDSGGTFSATEIAFTLPTGATVNYWDGDSYEPLIGNFTIGELPANGENKAYNFQITFDSDGSKSLTVRLVDTTPEPDFDLASIGVNISVGATYSVLGEISMQGRTFRGNVPVLLTKLDVPVYGPFPGTTVAQLGTNLTISNLPSGSYEFTTSQARYLNITADLDKQFTLGTANHILPALMLRGGNVVDTGEGVIPNKVDLSDAGLIGGAYGTSGNPLEIPADANFDGRVNILDLALVGGNYELTSADYDWSPVTLP